MINIENTCARINQPIRSPPPTGKGIVNWTMFLTDIGLAAVLVMLAIFILWRLYDLFQAKGYWNQELQSEKKAATIADIEEQKRKLEELTATLQEVSI